MSLLRLSCPQLPPRPVAGLPLRRSLRPPSLLCLGLLSVFLIVNTDAIGIFIKKKYAREKFHTLFYVFLSLILAPLWRSTSECNIVSMQPKQ